jgi:hypothetical protein
MPRSRQEVIHIHPEAPPKPPEGEPCNGCGVCCLAEPCPVGVLVSGRLKGACKALVWSGEAERYHCGMLVGQVGTAADAGGWASRLRSRWVRRMISAGSGCDASIEVAQAQPVPHGVKNGT